MAKKELAEIIKSLQGNPEFIRNIGIVAHIDHGKTTLSDNLLAGAGMISKELAGKMQFMDFDPQEIERGITIFSANASMVHVVEGKEYLVNLIDTPGHVDFGGDVTRAMRAVDGVIVIVDAVESVMPQTETVIRQALRERVKPVLFINKVDRLVNELKLSPESIQERFKIIIEKVNTLIKKYAEEQYKEEWLVNVNSGSVAFGSASQNWAISSNIIKRTGVGFKEAISYIQKDDTKNLAEKIPLHLTVLDMVVNHLPNPIQAQKYRVEKIWMGDLNSEAGKDMINCNQKGKLSAIVTKVYPDQHTGYISTVRIFSGEISSGQDVYLVGKGKINKALQVSVYKGPSRIQMESVKAGNIVGIVGLQDAYSGETICSPGNPIYPFESISHMFEPVVTKAIEPRRTNQLTKFISILKKVSMEDPTLKVKINEETGQYLVSGLGELHIDAKVERPLKDEGIDVDVSPPIVIYHESVLGQSKQIEIKSPNGQTIIHLKVSPIEKEILEAMDDGKLPCNFDIKKKDANLIEKLIKNGMNKSEAENIRLIHNKNILIDISGISIPNDIMDSIKDGFRKSVDEGHLARESCVGVKIILTNIKLPSDSSQAGPSQIVPSVVWGCKEGMKDADPILQEPIQIIRLDVPSEYIGNVMNDIQSRRGQIMEVGDESGSSTILVKVPVSEMFGFNSSLKSATNGRGFFWIVDVLYDRVPKELEQKIADDIRRRKGLRF